MSEMDELRARVERLEQRFPEPPTVDEVLDVFEARRRPPPKRGVDHLYLMPGVTGDPVTDNGNELCALWNRHRGLRCTNCPHQHHTWSRDANDRCYERGCSCKGGEQKPDA